MACAGISEDESRNIVVWGHDRSLCGATQPLQLILVVVTEVACRCNGYYRVTTSGKPQSDGMDAELEATAASMGGRICCCCLETMPQADIHFPLPSQYQPTSTPHLPFLVTTPPCPGSPRSSTTTLPAHAQRCTPPPPRHQHPLLLLL